MKKYLLLSLLSFATFVSAIAEKKEVDINPIAQPRNGQNNNLPRSPIYQPHIFIEYNTLFFDFSCIGCSIQLLQDDIVVYTDVVNEDGEIILPDCLSGVYQLQLQFGSIIFEGEIEL